MTTTSSSMTQWFDQRPLRERALLLVCSFIVLIFLTSILVLQPLSQKTQSRRNELTELKNSLVELKTQETVVTARRNNDPDRENRLRLEILEQESSKLQQQLQASIVNLVAPRDMPELLKNLLTRQKNLQLVSLENLPPEQLVLEQKAAPDSLGPVLYRHGLRMEFSGDYLTLLRYLNQLEELPRALVWDEVDIETREYPESRVRIQVHTLSLSEGWIGG
ncbi:MAG: type II secretion system protein M [Deltaproteobacteria bacterium]|nr:type II secretion system protein M [Deltaproteobacteria bacterium]